MNLLARMRGALPKVNIAFSLASRTSGPLMCCVRATLA
jgi:hypothetical protein